MLSCSKLFGQDEPVTCETIKSVLSTNILAAGIAVTNPGTLYFRNPHQWASFFASADNSSSVATNANGLVFTFAPGYEILTSSTNSDGSATWATNYDTLNTSTIVMTVNGTNFTQSSTNMFTEGRKFWKCTLIQAPTAGAVSNLIWGAAASYNEE